MNREDYMPEFWSDDERMSALMSMFKKREVNPTDYDSKMSFWSNLIHSSCAHQQNPLFELKTLYQRFKRKDRIPSGLKIVLENMLNKGEIQTYESFKSGPEGWVSWGVSSLSKPVGWFLGYNNEPDYGKTQFVCPSLIKIQADEVFRRYEEHSAYDDPMNRGIIEYPSLRNLVKDICPTSTSLDLAIMQLERDGDVTRGTSSQGASIVKFRDSSHSRGKGSPVQLTEIDKNLISLRTTLVKVEREIEKIEENMKKCENEARAAIRAGNRNRAKNQLRQKALFEKKLKERDAQYVNLQNLLHSVDGTNDKASIVDAMKAGHAAMKQNMERHGLSAENAETTIDQIHEAFDDYNEISDALSNGLRSQQSVSDEDLEGELAELLDTNNGEQVDDQLPPVPTSSKSLVGQKRMRPNDGLDWPEVPLDVSLEPEIPASSSSHNHHHQQPMDRLAKLRRQLEAAD